MERWQRNTLIAIALFFVYKAYEANTIDRVEEPSALEVCREENNIVFNDEVTNYLLEELTEEQLEALANSYKTDEFNLYDEEDEQAYQDELKRYANELFSKCGDA
jgi:hypothetical protein